MSKKTEEPVAEGRALLGRRCIEVHHGTLWVDERIANILRLSENQVLPDPTPEEEETESTEKARKRQVVLTPIIRVKPSRKRLFRALSVLSCFAVVGVWEANRQWSRVETTAAPGIEAAAVPARTRARPAPRPAELEATIERDENGAAVRISAAHPAAVLAAFCDAAGPASACRPLDTISQPGQPPGTLLGRFQDPAAAEGSGAILIYLDPRTSRWNAGDGVAPIRPL